MSRAQKGILLLPLIAVAAFAAILLVRGGHDAALAESSPEEAPPAGESQSQIDYKPVTEPEQAPEDVGVPLEQFPPDVQEATVDDQAKLEERMAGVEGEQAEIYARGLESRAILIEAQRAAGVEVMP